MSPMIEWGNVEEAQGFAPIPAGQYELTLMKGDYKAPASADKSGYYNLEFTVNGGEFNGRKLWHTMSLHPNSLPYTKRDLIRLGANPDDLAPGSGVDTDDIVAACVGSSVLAMVVIEPYTRGNGDSAEKNVIKEFNSLPF